MSIGLFLQKTQQRPFLLRKLRSFEVSQCTLTIVYQSLIESFLTFNIVSWFRYLTVKNKTKLSKVIKKGSAITNKLNKHPTMAKRFKT